MSLYRPGDPVTLRPWEDFHDHFEISSYLWDRLRKQKLTIDRVFIHGDDVYYAVNRTCGISFREEFFSGGSFFTDKDFEI